MSEVDQSHATLSIDEIIAARDGVQLDDLKCAEFIARNQRAFGFGEGEPDSILD